jgi:hypothetical protein
MPRDRIVGPVTFATLSALAALVPLMGCGGAPSSSLFGSGNGPEDGGSQHYDDGAPPPVVDASVPVVDGGPPHLPDGAPPPPVDAGPVVDSAAPDANPPDAGPWSPVCPASLPATGTPCTGQDQCEYGDAWWSVGCDTVVQCQNGQWGPYQPGAGCTPKPGPNPASCPGTYGSVPVGQSCPSLGLSCVYGQGICACDYPFGPPPPPGNNGNWNCLPEQGCPFPRPRLGSACPTDGTSCTYEEVCSYTQNCTGGIWQAQQVACVGGTQGGGKP